MGIKSGSDKHWAIIEQTQRLHDAISNTQVSSDAYDEAVKHAAKFADRLIEDHGVDDEIVNDIIKKHLRW